MNENDNQGADKVLPPPNSKRALNLLREVRELQQQFPESSSEKKDTVAKAQLPTTRIAETHISYTAEADSSEQGDPRFAFEVDQHADFPKTLARFKIEKLVGKGGFARVFLAYDPKLDRKVALKVPNLAAIASAEFRERFDREARLAASLSNPHSVMIYDYGRSEEGEAFCVMEFLKGVTLYEVVARSGYVSYGRALLILRQVCDALAEAHNMGLLHRDVKPQNVMLSLDPTVGDWAVVFDFGLAKPVKPEAGSYQTSETVWAGTPMYMAPERYRDPGGMDPRSDIYSVGCILYFLLSGRPPYMECDPESLFALVLSEKPIGVSVHRGENTDPRIVDLIDRCMAKNPEDRFRSMEELAAAVDALRSEFPWTVDEAREWWHQHGEED